MTAHPVAYLRRSRVDTKRPGTISHELQVERVRAAAAAAGDDPDALEMIEDWGRSGRGEKIHLRAGIARLEELVASGQVTAVYAYNLSRLGRSIETVSRLARLCAEAKVPIRCAEGDSPDISTPGGRLIMNLLNAIHEWQADWTAERAAEAAAVRRTRGDHMGPAPYGFAVVDGKLVERPSEDVSAVVNAYREAGSLQGAARLLTLQGAPTRRGEAWTASSVSGMLQRVAPDVLPAPSSRRKVSASFRLSGLLKCPHDGAMLTGRTFRGRYVAYSCRRAGEDPSHPHPRTISEDKVLDWIVAQVDEHLRVPIDQVHGDPEAEARRPELEARRERFIEMYGDGLIDKVRRDTELLAIADELEQLGAQAVLIEVPDFELDWPPQAMNDVLRAMLEHVELGPDLLPIAVLPRVPEWWT